LVRPVNAETLIAAVSGVLSNSRYRAAARRAGDSVAGASDPVEVCHLATR